MGIPIWREKHTKAHSSNAGVMKRRMRGFEADQHHLLGLSHRQSERRLRRSNAIRINDVMGRLIRSRLNQDNENGAITHDNSASMEEATHTGSRSLVDWSTWTRNSQGHNTSRNNETTSGSDQNLPHFHSLLSILHNRESESQADIFRSSLAHRSITDDHATNNDEGHRYMPFEQPEEFDTRSSRISSLWDNQDDSGVISRITRRPQVHFTNPVADNITQRDEMAGNETLGINAEFIEESQTHEVRNERLLRRTRREYLPSIFNSHRELPELQTALDRISHRIRATDGAIERENRQLREELQLQDLRELDINIDTRRRQEGDVLERVRYSVGSTDRQRIHRRSPYRSTRHYAQHDSLYPSRRSILDLVDPAVGGSWRIGSPSSSSSSYSSEDDCPSIRHQRTHDTTIR